jgi:hypothetical protein
MFRFALIVRSWSLGLAIGGSLAVAVGPRPVVAQEAAAELAPGDQVELDWAGKTVTGEVLERTATGWLKVKFTWNGSEMTPALPPAKLRRLAKAKEPMAGAVRKWKDSTGKFEIEAGFVRQDGDNVLLQKVDGATIKVPLAKLSAEDQTHVADLLRPAAPMVDPANPFDTAEVVKPATKPAAKPAVVPAEQDRPADYAAVTSVVPQPAPDKPFTPDAEKPLPFQPSNKAAVLTAGASGRDRFFEGPRSVLVAREAGRAVLAAVNSPPGGERKLRVLRCDLASMKSLGEIETPSFGTPVDISPSGQLLACYPDWTARRHGEKEMIEIVRFEGDSLVPVRRWPMGDNANRDQKFEHLYFVGEDRLLTTSAWGSIVLWDIDNAQALWQLKLTTHHKPAVSANRKHVAALIDGQICVFDTATGDTLARFAAPTEQHGVLSISTDGRRVASLSSRVLHVWDIATGRLAGEVWFPKQMFARSLDWCGEDYVLVDRGSLVDIAKRIIVWEYDLPTGRPDAIATMAGGRYWLASGSGNDGYQLAGFAVPDAAARKLGDSLTAAQVLAVKPGAAVSIKINLPGATAGEVKKVTDVLIGEAKGAGLVLTPNAPLVIECSIADQGEEKAEYSRFGAPFGGPFGPRGPFGPFGNRNAGEEATVNKKLSVISIKENGKELWVASGHYGAPFHVQIKEGQTLQEAVSEQKGNPVQFFLTAKLPRYIARHGADGTYGKSKLWP